MKVLLYFEGESMISTSGIGRALKHQQQALDAVHVKVIYQSLYALQKKNVSVKKQQKQF